MPITPETVKSKGHLVADNETYTIHDYDLDDLTVSVTELKKGKATRGHSHSSTAEVYFFPEGSNAEMTVGEESFAVNRGTVLIPRGAFHRVANKSNDSELQFVAVFSGKRSESRAKYTDGPTNDTGGNLDAAAPST